MRYIKEKQMLFLHIIKTGGVAVENAIDSRWPLGWRMRHRKDGKPGWHMRKSDIAGLPFVPTAFAFCFVRHPLHWHISCWRHLQFMRRRRVRRGSNLMDMFHWFDWHPQMWYAEQNELDFNAWIDRIVERDPGHLSKMFEEYVGLDRKTPNVQYVGRQETLTEDLDHLLQISKTPLKNFAQWPMPKISKQSIQNILKSEKQILHRYYGLETSNFRYVEDWK